MTHLHVTQPGSVVRYEGGNITVWSEASIDSDDGPQRQRLAAIEPQRLSSLVLHGNTHITANAMRLCSANKVPVAILDTAGNLAARLVPPEARNAEVRILQYRFFEDSSERLERARLVVSAKIANARALLGSVASNHSSEALTSAVTTLKTFERRVGSVGRMDELLGVEGSAARAYFSAFGTVLRGDFEFTRRVKRPPPDPINSLLSFGYVLLSNRITGLLEARGADPCLGFLHELAPGRPSLALDILEEFRHPVVDRLVIRLCNLRRLQQEHFQPDAERPGGVRLTLEGRKLFLQDWEKHLARPMREVGVKNAERLDIHRLLRRQVDRFLADIRDGEPYRPFLSER